MLPCLIYYPPSIKCLLFLPVEDENVTIMDTQVSFRIWQRDVVWLTNFNESDCINVYVSCMKNDSAVNISAAVQSHYTVTDESLMLHCKGRVQAMVNGKCISQQSFDVLMCKLFCVLHCDHHIVLYKADIGYVHNTCCLSRVA